MSEPGRNLKGQLADLDALWLRYRRSTREPHRTRHRNALVEHYLHLVNINAGRLSKKFGKHISYEELVSAGYTGLIEAVESFDPDLHAKFETFAQYRIRGSILDWIREIDIVPRAIRKFDRIQNQRTQLAIASERALSDDELTDSPSVAARLKDGSRFARTRSLQQLNLSDDRPVELEDKKAADPHQPVTQELLFEMALCGCSPLEQKAITLYFLQDHTMLRTGRKLQLSESRVSQIIKQVIDRLRLRFADAQLGDFY